MYPQRRSIDAFNCGAIAGAEASGAASLSTTLINGDATPRRNYLSDLPHVDKESCAIAGASDAASPPIPTSLMNGDSTSRWNHLHDLLHLGNEACGAIVGASGAPYPPIPTSLMNGDATPCRNHLHDLTHVGKEACGAIAGVGASGAASPPLPTSLMKGDAMPCRNHLHDLPHLDKEVCGAIAGVCASGAASPPLLTSLINGDGMPCRNHLHDSPHLDKEPCGAIAAIGPSGAASPPLHTSRMNGDAMPCQNYLHDLLHLDKEDTTGENEYHNIFSQVFTSAVSTPRMQKCQKALHYILDQLSNIWAKSEWKANLTNSFCNYQFRTTFLNVLMFLEKELEMCLKGNSSGIDQESSINYAIFTKLLQLILPDLLTLLQYMQALWTKAVASNIPDVLEAAKHVVVFENPGKTLQVLNINEKELEENAIRVWLETTRQSGYNVIGMCAQLEGAFDQFLSSSAVCGSLMKDLSSMGFHHLTLLIKYTIIPLVKNCPKELWAIWVVELLYPVFEYFHCTLYESWCQFLHEGLVQVPDTIVYVSVSEDKAGEKMVGGLPHCSWSEKDIEKDLLIQLTRAASDLLAVIASPELNGGDYVCKSSLVGYVLCHDVLRLLVLSLINYIFGAWKDDKAKMTSVPFCRQVVEIAKATRHKKLISFVEDDMISHVIRCLTLEPSLNSTLLTDLCRDAYKCVQNKDLMCEEKYNGSTEESTEESAEETAEESSEETAEEGIEETAEEGTEETGTEETSTEETAEEGTEETAEESTKEAAEEKIFNSWLDMQKLAVLCRNTPFHELEEFVWTWEIEEEFMDYFPAYIDMLHQVDEMDDCCEWGYCSATEFFNKKLKPEFKSRYAIDSESHDYVWTMSSMLSRKMSARYWQTQNDQMYELFCALINLKPYIQHSSYDDSVVELVKNLKVCPGLAGFLRVSALEEFCAILSLWEPQFHPKIREAHKNVLRDVFLHITRVENITFLRPLQPDLSDFPVHLRPWAKNYMDAGYKMYDKAKEQARSHEMFDELVASSALDHYICKENALEAVLSDASVSQFSSLDNDLIKLSIERRAKLLDRKEQLHLYCEKLRRAVDNEQLNIVLQSLMRELEAKDFFNMADDSMDWDKKCFLELVRQFDEQVFIGLQLPDYDVIRGIMDYRAMSLLKNASCSWDHVFEKVVGEQYRRWIRNIPLFWMNTRNYEHEYYAIIQQPLQKIWTKESQLEHR